MRILWLPLHGSRFVISFIKKVYSHCDWSLSWLVLAMIIAIRLPNIHLPLVEGGVLAPAGSMVSFCDLRFIARNLRALNWWAISKPSLRRDEVPRFFLIVADFPSSLASDCSAIYTETVKCSQTTYTLLFVIILWIIVFFFTFFFLVVRWFILRLVVVTEL